MNDLVLLCEDIAHYADGICIVNPNEEKKLREVYDYIVSLYNNQINNL